MATDIELRQPVIDWAEKIHAKLGFAGCESTITLSSGNMEIRGRREGKVFDVVILEAVHDDAMIDAVVKAMLKGLAVSPG